MKVMIIDIDKCNGCYNCQIACKDEHVGNDWSPYARPQPDTGHFWMKITDVVRGSLPKVKISYLHDICQHCDEAPCLSACRQQAIYKRADGIVIIDPLKCAGRMDCLASCPYKGVIYYNETLGIAQKCTFCAHLLDKGWTEPRCVGVCPTGALKFGEEDDLKEIIAGAEVLHPEYNTRPRVYYLGLPKSFITGAVFSQEEDAVISGADVFLTDIETGNILSTRSDAFGDFWFKNLTGHNYSLRIECAGYKPKLIENIRAGQDINLGDIPLG